MRLSLSLVAAVFWGVPGTSPALAEDTSCAPIRSVQAKLNNTERFQLFTVTLNDGLGNVATTDVRMVKWKMYERSNAGPWRVLRRPIQTDTVAGISTVSNCEHVGDEVLNGVPTIAFTYDRFRPQSKMRVRMSISKETGLPIRTRFKGLDSAEDFVTTYKYDSSIGEPDTGP